MVGVRCSASSPGLRPISSGHAASSAQIGSIVRLQFGARAAAERIFHTSPDRLSLQQAALLASVLPDPGGLDAGRPSVHVQQKARWVRAQMEQLGGTRLLEHL